MKLLRTIFLSTFAIASVGTQIGGCSFDNSSTSTSSEAVSIPHRARIVGEGQGAIAFNARDDGHVYAYDEDLKTVLDDRPIRHGQSYLISPDQNRITLDDKKVFNQDLKRKHAFQIYFLGDHPDRNDEKDARLPRSAQQVVDGHGKLLYTSRDDGRAFVYDEDADRVVFSHALRDGQRLAIDADKDQITIDEKSVFTGNLEKKHSFRIYFDQN